MEVTMKNRFWLGAGFLGLEFFGILTALIVFNFKDVSSSVIGLIVGSIILIGLNILAIVLMATGTD